MTGAVCYGVSFGEWSQYGIARVFATRAEAEAWRKQQEMDCWQCKGRGHFNTGYGATPGGLIVPRKDQCRVCEGTGRVNDYEVEEFPFGPEEEP